MAECHWAKSFPPPDHRTVTLWLMQVVPWVWTSFFARRLRMAAGTLGAAMAASPKRWLEAGRQCVSLLTVIIALPLISPLALGLELALIAVLIAGLVPLGVVRDFVARINTVISAILGNSFMYASSAMRQQAVISKIRANLDWLESKWACKHLVILGHSQGAALSYLSLKQHFPAKVRLLITFGSGLLKLHQLNDVRLKWWIWWFCSSCPFYWDLSLLVVAEWLDLVTYSPGTQWYYTVGAFFLLLLVITANSREYTDDIRSQASEYARHGLKWIDAYASMDPVPNGPLFLSNVPIPESIEVRNNSSLIGDHTSYVKNEDEFLLMIIRAIGQYSGTELRIADLTPYDKAMQAYAKRLRRIRIASNKIDEYLLFAALVAFLLNFEAIKFVGIRLNEWINAICVSAGLASCWGWSPVASGLLVTLVAYVF